MEAALFPLGMAYPGPPGVVMRVEHRDGQPLLLTATIAWPAQAADPVTAALEAGDLDRCLEWAWIG